MQKNTSKTNESLVFAVTKNNFWRITKNMRDMNIPTAVEKE